MRTCLFTLLAVCHGMALTSLGASELFDPKWAAAADVVVRGRMQAPGMGSAIWIGKFEVTQVFKQPVGSDLTSLIDLGTRSTETSFPAIGAVTLYLVGYNDKNPWYAGTTMVVSDSLDSDLLPGVSSEIFSGYSHHDTSDRGNPLNVAHECIQLIRMGALDRNSLLYWSLVDPPGDGGRIEEMMRSPSNILMNPSWCIESKTNECAAVVVVASLTGNSVQLHPMCMVRLDDYFFVIPGHDDIAVAKGSVTESTMRGLVELSTWFDGRKAELTKLISQKIGGLRESSSVDINEDWRERAAETLRQLDPDGFPHQFLYETDRSDWKRRSL